MVVTRTYDSEANPASGHFSLEGCVPMRLQCFPDVLPMGLVEKLGYLYS